MRLVVQAPLRASARGLLLPLALLTLGSVCVVAMVLVAQASSMKQDRARCDQLLALQDALLATALSPHSRLLPRRRARTMARWPAAARQRAGSRRSSCAAACCATRCCSASCGAWHSTLTRCRRLKRRWRRAGSYPRSRPPPLRRQASRLCASGRRRVATACRASPRNWHMGTRATGL